MLAGRWQGIKRFWPQVNGVAVESKTSASITLEARGNIVKIDYEWVQGGVIEEGQLLVGQGNRPADAQGMWADSGHRQDKIMVCQGHFEENGDVTLHGTYPGPEDANWGWRIPIDAPGEDRLVITMDNISPAGEKFRAVEIQLITGTSE